MSVAAIILAAGRSTRMGTNKLLEELFDRPLVRHVADAALASNARPVLVVTGHQPERVEAVLDGLPLTVVHNPDFSHGLSTSLKAGVAALPSNISAVIVLLGDMPFITAGAIDNVIAAFEAAPNKIAAVPVHEGKWGNPVLLSRALFAKVADLEGDAGARKLLIGHAEEIVEVLQSDNAVLTDLDTPEALARARLNSRDS